jgi:hypothetical protein
MKSKNHIGIVILALFLVLGLSSGIAVAQTGVSVSPATQNVSQGAPFTIDITVNPDTPILGVQFDMSFDPSLVEANSVTEGNLLNQDGAPTFFDPGTIDNTAGTITGVAGAIIGGGAAVSGSGTFATISFTAKMADGTSPLDLSNVVVGDADGAVSNTTTNGIVTVGEVEECGTMDVSPTSWSPTIADGASDSQTVTVSASGGAVEGVTVSIVSGPAWLNASPTNLGDIASGSSATFTMTAAPPSGTSGDFAYTIQVSNTCGTPTTTDVTGTITVLVEMPTTVTVTPQVQSVSKVSPFTVSVDVDPAVPILGVQLDLSFDTSLVEANSVTEGNLLNQDGASTSFLPGTIDNTAGTITGVAGAIIGGGAPVSSPGTFATISFTAKTTAGTSPLDLSNVVVGDASGAVTNTTNDGSVTVNDGAPQLCTSPDPPTYNFGNVPEGETRTRTFDITNCGGGTLTWTVSDDQPWLTVSPSSGDTTTETDTVTVTIDTTGLTCDATYTGTVTVTSDGGTKTGTISVSVPCAEAAPVLTPIGIMALVGLLVVLAVSKIREKV